MAEQQDDGISWGKLLLGAAAVTGAMVAAPMVLDSVGSWLSGSVSGIPGSALPGAGVDPTGFSASLGNIVQGAGDKIASLNSYVADVVGFNGAALQQSSYLNGAAQSAVLSQTGTAITNGANQAWNVISNNPKTSAALAGAGLVVGRMVSSNDRPQQAAPVRSSFAEAELARRARAAQLAAQARV